MSNVIDLEVDAETPADKVRTWTRLLDENLMGVECKNAGEDLRASVRLRAVDSGSINRTRFTRQTLFRTPGLIKRPAEDETSLLVFVREGTHTIRQGHQSATLDGNGIYFLDSSRPFEVDFASDHISQAALHVPRTAIAKRLGAVENLAFGPEVPLQQLLSTFAFGMIDSFEVLDNETLDALLNQTLDLFALMVAKGKETSIDPSTHRAGTLLRIKAYANAHLRDDTLTLERTARALGISPRYVNALLAAEGISFGRYVLAQRLEHARCEIIDPRRARKQVTEVAFDWGFKNTSHFGRAFKEKYGMSPRDAKMARALT